jgi:hypothetical protein
VTPLLLIGLAVVLIFLLGFLAGLGVERGATIARGKRQAAQQRMLNEMWCTLREQQEHELRHAVSTQAGSPYIYDTSHGEVDWRS